MTDTNPNQSIRLRANFCVWEDEFRAPHRAVLVATHRTGRSEHTHTLNVYLPVKAKAINTCTMFMTEAGGKKSGWYWSARVRDEGGGTHLDITLATHQLLHLLDLRDPDTARLAEELVFKLPPVRLASIDADQAAALRARSAHVDELLDLHDAL